MAGSLIPIRERVGWARQRLDELNAACDEFVTNQSDETAPGVRIQIDAPAGRWEMRARVPAALPAKMAYLVGEILLHMRGSLDNLAWQLVLANDGTPTKRTEFPVFKDEAEFKSGSPRRMAGMSDSARAVITALQPFNAVPEDPDNAILWKIHDLNLIDKHRLPHLICLWLAWVKVEAVVGPDGRFEPVLIRGCMEDDAVLIRALWDPTKTPPGTNMKMDFELSVDVALRNPGQVAFVSQRNEAVDSIPLRYLFEIGLNYLEGPTLSLFEPEFALLGD